jgi:hypothetical protein
MVNTDLPPGRIAEIAEEAGATFVKVPVLRNDDLFRGNTNRDLVSH